MKLQFLNRSEIHFKNGFISRALIISSSRFIALSLPLCDMIMLGHQGNEYVKNFSVAAQFSQIFVILSIMLSIGINIVIGKSRQEKKKYIQGVFRYSIYLATCLVIISLIITPVFYNHIEILKIYLIFSISLFPLCIYVGIANILETIKLERKILIITLYSSVANVILNYVLINWMNNSAIAVSLSTCFIRILILFPVVNLLLKQKIRLSPKKIPGLNKEIFILGRSSAITSLCFTGGLSVLVMYITNNMKSEYAAFFGLTLNFMNTISVIFVGMAISLTISLSKNNGNIESITIINIKKSILYITSFSLLFYLITPLLPYVYLGNENKMLTQFFVLSIGVVAFDGIAQTFISILLVYGMSQLPPLFRLSLIFIGIPMSFFFTIDENPIANIIKFMMLGNMLASVFSLIYFIKCFPQIKKRPKSD